jgi:uridylate kinase
VVLAAGTGNPFVTTDYPSAQRALELRAEALLVAKHGTDGIYTGDPRQQLSVRRYRKIDYDTVIQQNLRALDQSAVLLARDHHLPIHVFDFNKVGAMRRICEGDDEGTLISNHGDEFE